MYSCLASGASLKFFYSLSCPIDHTSGRSFEGRHKLDFRHTSVRILLKECKVLVTDKLKDMRMLGYRNLYSSAHGDSTALIRSIVIQFSLYSGNEYSVCVETEDLHLLHTTTVRIDSLCPDIILNCDIHHETHCDISFRNL